jgi:hypothetical protein
VLIIILEKLNALTARAIRRASKNGQRAARVALDMGICFKYGKRLASMPVVLDKRIDFYYTKADTFKGIRPPWCNKT